MDAVEYLKEKARMTDRCKNNCIYCPLNKKQISRWMSCVKLQYNFPEEAVEIVEQWSKEHPKKTYLSVLLEKFPKASLGKRGLPKYFCPEEIFGGEKWLDCDVNNCVECWNREYEE